MWHVLTTSFGISAAVLIVGGYFGLQWQRNRHRFQLMQSALERGITEFPERIPFWLVSLRQGAAILVLGLGLLIVGGIAHALAWGVEPPNAPTAQCITSASDKEVQARAPEEKTKPPRPERPRPPMPNPALEQWHRAENQKTVGLALMGCGLLLAMLGGVRIGFSRVEKTYTNSKQSHHTV